MSEIGKLLKKIRKKNNTILFTAYDAELRVSEVVRLQMKDVVVNVCKYLSDTRKVKRHVCDIES